MGLLLITTSRHTNPRVRSLVKELALAIGGSIRVTRGKRNFRELCEYARSLKASRVVIVGRGLSGNPGRVVFLDSMQECPRFYPLIIGIAGIRLGREMGVKVTPPPTVVPVIPSPASREDVDLIEFSQELAGALDRPFIEIDPALASAGYSRAILVEGVKRRKAKLLIKFVELPSLRPAGPSIFVGKWIYRGAEVAEERLQS